MLDENKEMVSDIVWGRAALMMAGDNLATRKPLSGQNKLARHCDQCSQVNSVHLPALSCQMFNWQFENGTARCEHCCKKFIDWHQSLNRFTADNLSIKA